RHTHRLLPEAARGVGCQDAGQPRHCQGVAGMMPPDPRETSSSTRAANLMALFPGGDSAFLKWRATTGSGRKPTATRHQAPTMADYAEHLAAASFAGPGAIGVKLARTSEDGNIVCSA